MPLSFSEIFLAVKTHCQSEVAAIRMAPIAFLSALFLASLVMALPIAWGVWKLSRIEVSNLQSDNLNRAIANESLQAAQDNSQSTIANLQSQINSTQSSDNRQIREDTPSRALPCSNVRMNGVTIKNAGEGVIVEGGCIDLDTSNLSMQNIRGKAYGIHTSP